MELVRDPLRLIMAFGGSLFLMVIMGYGINMDVENLKFAVLDRDQSILSQDYVLNIAGSRYFIERPPITDYAELDRRMCNGELSLAIEIPPKFEQNFKKGNPVQISAWIDGAMPMRAETVQGYVQGMHQSWLLYIAGQLGQDVTASATIETRFRYNPDVKSLPAMVPSVVVIVLLMIPAMLTALSVVREKELGSIINFYVTQVTRTEFLFGKQLPYIAVGMINFVLISILAVTVFGVPMKGSFFALMLAAIIFVMFSTGFGLLCSTFTKSQIAAMFISMIGTTIPAQQFSGIYHPVSALDGAGHFIGTIYPATYFIIISRGVFNKALKLVDLYPSFWPILVSVPVIFGLSVMLLKKQES